MELLGKCSNWWTHYSKDGSFNAWGCQATCLVQVVLNQTLKCWSFERNTKRGLLIVPWVRLRSQNGWHWTLKTHISCHNLAFRSNGGEDQSDKKYKYPTSDAATECNPILHTFHWARICTIKRWYAVPKNSLHDCLCRTYSRSFIYNAGGSQTYALVLLVFEHEVQPYPCRDCFDTLCSQSFMISYLKHFAAPNKLAPQKSPGQYCCLAEKVFDNGISIQRSMAPFDLGCCLGVISDA